MQAPRDTHMSGETTHRIGVSEKKVRDVLTPDKRRLVEVPYTASLADTMNALVANLVVAVPVAAPPGHWIGAGGSMILESDKQTGAVRKHYIGMVTMLDILAHIAGDNVGDESDLDRRMAVPVSTIIGHCLESLSLWTLNPNTSVADCMEVFSKGIHRAMVPVDSTMENVAGVELVESASSYRMLTQMDLLRFLKSHESDLKNIMSRTVAQIGGISDIVFGVTEHAKVIDVIKCMRTASLNAVPILSANPFDEDHTQLINGKQRHLVGTFSSTDLRGCPVSQLQSWLQGSVLEFTEKFSTVVSSPSASSGQRTPPPRELVTCRADSTLGEVIDTAVNKHVHRVWVVDGDGTLDGLVSLTDMIRVIRVSMLSQPA